MPSPHNIITISVSILVLGHCLKSMLRIRCKFTVAAKRVYILFPLHTDNIAMEWKQNANMEMV